MKSSAQAKLIQTQVANNQPNLTLVPALATTDANFASNPAVTLGSKNSHLQKLKQVIAYQKAVREHGSQSSEAQELFAPIYEQGFRYAITLAFANCVTQPDTAQDLAQLTMLRVWKRITSGKEVITSVPGLINHSFHCERVNWLESSFHKRQQGKLSQPDTYSPELPHASFATGTNGKLSTNLEVAFLLNRLTFTA